MKTKFDDIKNLSDKKLIEGIRLCFENSDNLFKSALVLRRNKRYSVGTSILILSLEELVKASTLFNILLSDDAEKETFRDIFESNDLHKSRHRFALFMNEYLKTINLKKLMKTDIQFDNPQDLSTFLQTKINFNKISENIDKEKKNLNNWFSHANARKNNGLYVAYNNKWHTPNRINQKEFEKSLKETKKIRADLGIGIKTLLSVSPNEIDSFSNFMRQTLKQFQIDTDI